MLPINIQITSKLVNSNPHMDSMPVGSTHWRCTLRRTEPRRQMTVAFSMGPAHLGEPVAMEVLYCLLVDAQALDLSFDEWCSDFGYDTDSRRALATYKACRHAGEKLHRFLGDDIADVAKALENY